MRAFIVATAVSAVLAVWGATGAATLDLKPTFTETGSTGGRILFETSEFKDRQVRRIIYSDLWQREEYAHFSGKGAQAEAIYASPKKPRIAMQFLHDFERIARSFRHIRGRPTIWDNEGEMSHNLGKIRYRIFYLPDKHRSCFIFKSEWSDPPDDPGGRAGSILFGYYCARPGIPLTGPIVSSFLIVWHACGKRSIDKVARDAAPDYPRPECEPTIVPGESRTSASRALDTPRSRAPRRASAAGQAAHQDREYSYDAHPAVPLAAVYVSLYNRISSRPWLATTLPFRSFMVAISPPRASVSVA